MPFPSAYVVEVDWNDNGLFSHANSDISSYVKEFSIERGREGELQDMQVGTCELRVLNTSKLFSPEYVGGSLFGKLLPDRRIRVKAQYGGNDYPLFYGYLERITPVPDKSRQDAYIYTVDRLRRLQTNVRSILRTGETEAQLMTALLVLCQKTAEGALPSAFDAGLDTHPYFWVNNESALEKCLHLAKSCLGVFYADKSGNFVFENRNHRPLHTSQYTFDNAHYSMDYNYGGRELKNQVTTKCYARAVSASAELWRLQEIPYIAPGETRYFEAVFDNPVSAITDPVATTDYTANNEAGGGGANRTVDMAVAITKYAHTAILAVTNNGTPHFYVTLLKCRGTPVTISDSGSYKADDSASQAVYGLRPEDFEGSFVSTIGWAENRSRFLLALKQNPAAEISMTLRPATEAILLQMIGREISDKVTVQETQTAVNSSFFIEKISHKVTMGPTMLETTWVLSALPGFLAWIVGTSALGINTGLGY